MRRGWCVEKVILEVKENTDLPNFHDPWLDGIASAVLMTSVVGRVADEELDAHPGEDDRRHNARGT